MFPSFPDYSQKGNISEQPQNDLLRAKHPSSPLTDSVNILSPFITSLFFFDFLTTHLLHTVDYCFLSGLPSWTEFFGAISAFLSINVPCRRL